MGEVQSPVTDNVPDEVESEKPSALRLKERDERLAARLDGLPAQPGCYLFRGERGAVLYVGKAKSLRSRVRSYFQAGSSDERAFIPWLRREVVDIETVLTGSEKEAAILENNLIKEYRPKYNVKLRDDKEFLCLRLDEKKAYPRLELVRKPDLDHARHFGPFPSATAARKTLHLVERHFQLRSCSDRELKSRQRPCIQYQIKRCPAPCVYDVNTETYQAQVRAVTLFLLGRHDAVTELLESRMRIASTELDFETAGVLRDQIRAIADVRSQQRIVSDKDVDVDVLGLYREGELVELVLLIVRSGRLLDVQRVSRVRSDVDDAEVVAAFLRERYEGQATFGESTADELWLPVLPEGAEGIEEWLNEAAAKAGRKRRIRLVIPQRGPKSDLIRLATDNAKHAFEEKRRSEEDIEARLARLQNKLRLPKMPHRIECVDISHLGGTDAVGAVVALLDGKPDKPRYRNYRVKPETPGDDYAAIFEVLSRRFLRGVKAKSQENESGEDAQTLADEAEKWQLPDLFVVDGGRGQLAVALTAASDLGITDLSIIGLAKEKESPTGEKLVDRVYLPGQKNPIALRTGSPEHHFLCLARDEAHRFSNRGRMKLGKARTFKSTLDDVPGIGPKTRKALLMAFGSVDAIRTASDEALLAVSGVNRRQVQALRDHWVDPDGESVADEELPLDCNPEGDQSFESETEVGAMEND
jgi:excinuclease ABC subunit C